MIGIVGGSGLYDLATMSENESLDIVTPFGRPSSPLLRGRVGTTDLVFLARHGTGHRYSPTDIPYRANIYALKELGVTHILGLSAVGSLREDLPPRALVLPDQIIDRTLRHERSFFEGGIVAHVGIADPFCSLWQDAVADAASAAGQSVHRGGTYVCIEGPQFSTRAESQLYRTWTGSVIGMTAMPEARLAREAELCFATLAMITDYDVWHESEADVSVEVVMSNLDANSRAASSIVRVLADRGVPERTCSCGSALDHAVVTGAGHVPAEARRRVALLVGHRFSNR